MTNFTAKLNIQSDRLTNTNILIQMNKITKVPSSNADRCEVRTLGTLSNITNCDNEASAVQSL